MQLRSLTLFAIVAVAAATCPNACSGNGVCGANDKCSCYQNWQGPDCGARTCTFALAWADTADGTNQAHYYAECANKGTCDRKTGECKCFDGYEGKGCRRSTCPESCSGHGTCEFIDELAVDFEDRRAGPGYDKKAANTFAVSNAVTDSDNTRVINGYLYQLWDAQKIQGCKCDLGYSGPDCSSRIAPKGDDPLTTVKSQHSVQMLSMAQGGAISGSSTATFFMIYYDQYGGVWRTDSILVGDDEDVNAARIQEALRQLPNQVLEDIVVTKRTVGTTAYCTRAEDGMQHIPSAEGHGTENSCASQGNLASNTAGNRVDVDIAFADKPGQTGVQFLFELVTSAQGDGSYPVSAGWTTTASNIYEMYRAEDNGDDVVSELAECSDRGLDNGEGECECFDGFRGLACEEQEALV
jgi:hypothetical protein